MLREKIQTEINEKMRHILIDWLIDVHLKFHLNKQTLFMAVNIIDRILSQKKIKKSEFQLLGISALFISAKYEDIYPPDIGEFCYVCAGAYEKDEIVKMEALILESLEFNLVFVSSYSMFSLYCTQCKIIFPKKFFFTKINFFF